jgi:NADH-quinone oxidoreductase subunit J
MEPTVLETILFIAFGVVAVVGALGVILARGVIYSALSMLANFAALGALYIMLSAEFLGVAQLIIYAGAIVVLFLFALMLVGGRKPTNEQAFRPFIAMAAVGLGVLLLGELGYLVLSTGIAGQLGVVTPQVIAGAGSVQILGKALFTQYLLPFEMVSVLLLIGIVGAVVLAKPRRTV